MDPSSMAYTGLRYDPFLVYCRPSMNCAGLLGGLFMQGPPGVLGNLPFRLHSKNLCNLGVILHSSP